MRGALVEFALSSGCGDKLSNESGTTIVDLFVLVVGDADGRSLPTRLPAADGKLTLTADDAKAHYPFTIDFVVQKPT